MSEIASLILGAEQCLSKKQQETLLKILADLYFFDETVWKKVGEDKMIIGRTGATKAAEAFVAGRHPDQEAILEAITEAAERAGVRDFNELLAVYMKLGYETVRAHVNIDKRNKDLDALEKENLELVALFGDSEVGGDGYLADKNKINECIRLLDAKEKEEEMANGGSPEFKN